MTDKPDKVVNLDDYRHDPHLSGNAACLACKHTWVAVVPVGTTILDCPACGLGKGVYANLVVPDTAWECRCGCHHFFVSPEKIICVLCGTTQVFG
jgi:hypothetical protein